MVLASKTGVPGWCGASRTGRWIPVPRRDRARQSPPRRAGGSGRPLLRGTRSPGGVRARATVSRQRIPQDTPPGQDRAAQLRGPRRPRPQPPRMSPAGKPAHHTEQPGEAGKTPRSPACSGYGQDHGEREPGSPRPSGGQGNVGRCTCSVPQDGSHGGADAADGDGSGTSVGRRKPSARSCLTRGRASSSIRLLSFRSGPAPSARSRPQGRPAGAGDRWRRRRRGREPR